MTGQELVATMRESILDDNAEPYLWKTTELLRNLNYAEVQACRRSHLLIDSTTANDSGTAGTASTAGQRPLCLLVLGAGTAVYTLSPKVLQVKRCQLDSMTYPLTGPLTYEEMDDFIPYWQGTGGIIGTCGTTGNSVVFLNEPGNTVTFVRCPSIAGTAYLAVSRLPLLPFTLATSPEIAERLHEGLMDWAAHLCYMKNDSDTQNLNLAALHAQKFTAQFGPLPDAYSERMRKIVSQRRQMRPREWGS